MADTKITTDIETPAGYNAGQAPGGALKLPVKKYSSSDLAKNPGKGTTIEGPCDGYKHDK